MGVVASEKGLHMVVLPYDSIKNVKKELEGHYIELIRNDDSLKDISLRIIEYFSGKEVDFNIKMDFDGSTDFELKVWDAVMGIPRGEVRSYEWISKHIGFPKKVRAVGQALSRNRLPVVIPCHRVVKKYGDIGGFSRGVNMKRLLLKLEGYLIC
ncbi:MAG: methylated-DNA-protein-cysteine S-methyltransferase [Candidatus Saganbacteria bacterium]|uniref:methylated-DNA--[protein]-cysteine S-methyltransferase n=1 Tax=Candidatus Saganbacteria bacterium TaxID=2575572 RepID=A0A833L2L6_UNCSA|nr:MAG: methylated-DNA-protein-cysteine S-methyltransferase [Candidatus Saganbacteria bacterium]